MLGARHPEEFSLETLVRLLEQGKDDSSYHPAETYPEVLPKIFGLKEMKKDIYCGRMAKVIAKDAAGQGQRLLQLTSPSRSW